MDFEILSNVPDAIASILRTISEWHDIKKKAIVIPACSSTIIKTKDKKGKKIMVFAMCHGNGKYSFEDTKSLIKEKKATPKKKTVKKKKSKK